MNWYSTIGIIASSSQLIPIFCITYFRLLNHRSFLALMIYYSLSVIFNFIQLNIIPVPDTYSKYLGYFNNIIDAPLILIFFLFLSYSAVMTKRIKASVLLFLAFNAIVTIIFGLKRISLQIILAPDIIVVSSLSLIFFLRNARLSIINTKSLGKTLMSSSLLLLYAILVLVYIYFYLLAKKQYFNDTMFIYYVATFLSSIIMSLGIMRENKRIKKLDELKTTRRELASIYGHTKTAAFNKAAATQ